MRIATWNVNSIKARLPVLLPWLESRAPDVVALQETKLADSAFPYAALAEVGYTAVHHGDGRWNGVAILSRVGASEPALGLTGHPEPRLVEARCGGLRVISVYVPNGRTLDDPHYAYKLAWFQTLQQRLTSYDVAEPLVIMGDFNVARTDDDVWDPRLFVGSTHVTPAERAAMDDLVGWGLVDVVPRPGKGDRPFTYFDYRAGHFHKNEGMRIDYLLATPAVQVKDAWVDREARKGAGTSDHCPVLADIEISGVLGV
jgi:exodeoxyribonuclease-3